MWSAFRAVGQGLESWEPQLSSCFRHAVPKQGLCYKPLGRSGVTCHQASFAFMQESLNPSAPKAPQAPLKPRPQPHPPPPSLPRKPPKT